uniref:Ionotropic glutamate receptor C-terminal domain-containing protein n=1 Tax=Plectus sambesii TaxID=2011161 RepID=A0A914UV88_9BILA
MPESNGILRVAIARNPPDAFDNCPRFPTFEQSQNCPYPGWCLEVLYMLTQYLNVTIQPVVTDYKVGSVDWGNLHGTTWSGVLGLIQNDTADTACLMYQKTPTREEYFDFATSVVSVQPVYVTKRKEVTFASTMVKVFKTFQVQLWVIMAIAVVVQIIFILIIDRIEFEMRREPKWQPLRLSWEMFRFFVRQGEGTYYRNTKGGNILMTIWGLASMLMLSLYEGLLLTELLHPTKVIPFENADEMIDLIAKKDFKYFDEMRNSNESHFVSLRAALAENPEVYVSTVKDALDLVENSNDSSFHYIYPIQQDSIAMQFANQRCNLVSISEGLPSQFAHFVFAKNSSWLKRWNAAIIQLQSFQMRTFNKYFMSAYTIGKQTNCTEKIEDEANAIRPLDPESMTGVCLVYSCGILISIFFGLFEQITRLKGRYSGASKDCDQVSGNISSVNSFNQLVKREKPFKGPLFPDTAFRRRKQDSERNCRDQPVD